MFTVNERMFGFVLILLPTATRWLFEIPPDQILIASDYSPLHTRPI